MSIVQCSGKSVEDWELDSSLPMFRLQRAVVDGMLYDCFHRLHGITADTDRYLVSHFPTGYTRLRMHVDRNWNPNRKRFCANSSRSPGREADKIARDTKCVLGS